MSKYNVGDVIKLRDDLKDLDWKWEKLKNIPLLINDKCEINGNGRYLVDEEWLLWASDKMIEGLWEDCKPKLKLIDVLNMIANGELKEGTKVKYDEEIYTFNDENELERELGFSILTDIYMNNLNNEVELLEPECKHEWNSAGKLCGGIQTTHKVCKKCGFEEITEKRIFEEEKTSEPTKIEEIQSPEIYGGITYHIIDKLNEVIRKLNKEE